MSESTFLEKMLDGAEVDWKPLGEVFDVFAGGDVPKEALSKIKTEKFNIPILSNGIGGRSLYGWTNIPKVKKPSLTISARGTIGWTSYRTEPFFPIVRLLVLTPKVEMNLRYYYHFMKTIENDYKVAPAGIPQLTKPMIKDAQLPIPFPNDPEKSLAIQAEIVRILDTFTELTTELTAELTARKKQYNYYRDQLLTFEEGEVEWKPLEEVATFRRGSFPQPYGNAEWYDGEGCMPFVQVADVANFGYTMHNITKQQISVLAQPKSIFVESGSVVVTLQGTIGRVAITQYDCYVDRTLAIFTSYKVKLNKKYFAHQLKAKFDKEKEFARGSTIKTITKAEFSKFEIPLPPINEQDRIVAILDKFDTLTHSISEGLPREIELRQKQYEYYRDLLLNFPKPQTEGVA